MKFINLIWIFSLGLWLSLFTLSHEASFSPIEHKILGRWYLIDQEMWINGKEINRHFEEVAANSSVQSGSQLDPHLLANKFRKGFRGIPSGTVFEFNDDFSYRIILPDKQIQDGLWRIKNTQTIVLNAQEQEMHIEIRAIGEKLATISIKEEKIDHEINGGRYIKMELVMDLSR